MVSPELVCNNKFGLRRLSVYICAHKYRSIQIYMNNYQRKMLSTIVVVLELFRDGSWEEYDGRKGG